MCFVLICCCAGEEVYRDCECTHTKKWAAQALPARVRGQPAIEMALPKLVVPFRVINYATPYLKHVYILQKLLLAIRIKYNSYLSGFTIVCCKTNLYLFPPFVKSQFFVCACVRKSSSPIYIPSFFHCSSQRQ